jgi:hypothetical protein
VRTVVCVPVCPCVSRVCPGSPRCLRRIPRSFETSKAHRHTITFTFTHTHTRLPAPGAFEPDVLIQDIWARARMSQLPHCLLKALESGGVHGFAIPVLQWWRRDSSRVASHEAGRPRRLEHSCRGCQDGLVTYGVGWLQRHLAAGRRHQHSCVSRSGDLPTTSASTHTRSHPQSRRISPAYLRHAFRTRGELPTAPI